MLAGPRRLNDYSKLKGFNERKDMSVADATANGSNQGGILKTSQHLNCLKTTITVSVMPPPVTPKPVLIDQQEATNFIDPMSQATESLINNVDFIASYPGPIYLDLNAAEVHANRLANNISKASKGDQKSEKNKIKYPFTEELCGSGCKGNCKLIHLEERKNLWDSYWNMPRELRHNFLNQYTRIDKIKRSKAADVNPNPKFLKNESRFTISRTYYFPRQNENINVCRFFFFKSLGYRTDAVLTVLSRALKRKILNGGINENRGGKKPRICRNDIVNHILSFNPAAVSHIRRKNAPLIRYLPRSLTPKLMFKDFKSKYPSYKFSKGIYRRTIKEMHISFKHPKDKKDKCVVCAELQKEMKLFLEEVPESLISKYDTHKTKADKAIKNYQLDARKEDTNNVRCYSMDLQEVMLLLDMPKVKDSFFLSRMIAFNLTFAPVHQISNINSTCVLWHEAWAGRDANNIVDALAAFLNGQRDLQHLVLWCDNCANQNKNWFMFTALVTLVNCGFSSIESITLKYLTKGHTHMAAYDVHGNIEEHIGREDAVYNFEDYKRDILSCRNNIDIIQVANSYQWLKKKRSARRNDNNDPMSTFLLNSIVKVKFVNGSRSMFYKQDFDEPYVELDFLMKKFDVKNLPSPSSTNCPRGLKAWKKKKEREFWLSLPTNDNAAVKVTDGQIECE